jgi:hypothetical protein
MEVKQEVKMEVKHFVLDNSLAVYMVSSMSVAN